MAAFQPTSLDEPMDVWGVDEAKDKRYGRRFPDAIMDYGRDGLRKLPGPSKAPASRGLPEPDMPLSRRRFPQAYFALPAGLP
ncbi:MAG: hypothetical protein IIT89_01570 [Aeriscardovia sp.]|nr:hypothetical protein [Aeriscardovia sp.]